MSDAGAVVPSQRYRTIVVDPPWQMPTGGSYSGSARYKKSPSELPYRTMQLDEIAALPVDALAEQSAHLYLWVPNAHIETAYELARGWRFRPSQLLVWAKQPRGLGLGGAFTNTTEFVLFARRGTLAPVQRTDTTWWLWKRPHNMHSAKPEGFLDMVELVSPAPYAELFSRRARFGWDYPIGDQALGGAEIIGQAAV